MKIVTDDGQTFTTQKAASAHEKALRRPILAFEYDPIPGEKRARQPRLPAVPKAPKIRKTPAQLKEELTVRIARFAEGMDNPRQQYPELQEIPPGEWALDFETYDPTLRTIGSAWAFPNRGGGRILGVAAAWEGFDAYWPLTHCGDNYHDPDAIRRWIIHHLYRPDLTVICANAQYDIGWAVAELGVDLRKLDNTGDKPAIEDVQFGAVLLNEHQDSYSLDKIGKRLLTNGGKNEELFDRFLELLPNLKRTDFMGNLQHIPGGLVVPYGRRDARMTYDIRQIQQPSLEAEDLIRVYNLENNLIPLTVAMRKQGVKVDVDAAERDSAMLKQQISELRARIKTTTGFEVLEWEAQTIDRVLITKGLTPLRTKTNKPQVQQAWLEGLVNEPIVADILAMRKKSKIAGTFLDGHILRHAQFNGKDWRVHAELNQLKSEKNEFNDNDTGKGAITGRFSVTDPGLQQLPVRDKEFGPLLRSKFLPEDGEEIASADYSAQEPRLIVHFAFLRKIFGAEEAVRIYLENPRIDYHQMTADLCGIARSPAKIINLGLGYGMGAVKLAKKLGLPVHWEQLVDRRYRALDGTIHKYQEWICIEQDDDASNLIASGNKSKVREAAGIETLELIHKWEAGVPFMRGLDRAIKREAREQGYITSLLGRRMRFPFLPPPQILDEEGCRIVKYSDYKPKRDGINKALNSLIQPSAADQTKTAMVHMWQAGIVPMITIHDELVLSTPPDHIIAERMRDIMINAIPLAVPTVVDVKYGRTLGDIPK